MTEKVKDAVKEQYLATDYNEIRMMQEESKKSTVKQEIAWRNVALFGALHFGALIGLYQLIFMAKWMTVGWVFFLHCVGAMGVTAGAHRLWAHRSFKARFPMRVLLMMMNNVAFQNDIIEWARDHRCHHKWTDTDADPHSTNRGMFFAHMGWLLVKKHPKLKEQGAKLDLSDLYSDPVLAFQRKHFMLLGILSCFVMPAVVATYFWGEASIVAFYTASLFRYTFLLHVTWCINSVSHWIGWKPYSAESSAVENWWTTITAVGEGGHNYHHAFPQDYRTSEHIEWFNWTKILIDTGAAIGWVYDRKTASEEMIQRQCSNFGDEKQRKDVLQKFALQH